MMWQPEGTYWTQLREIGPDLRVQNELLDEWVISELGPRVWCEIADEQFCFGGALTHKKLNEYFVNEQIKELIVRDGNVVKIGFF